VLGGDELGGDFAVCGVAQLFEQDKIFFHCDEFVNGEDTSAGTVKCFDLMLHPFDLLFQNLLHWNPPFVEKNVSPENNVPP
jgi:hypothetical protein